MMEVFVARQPIFGLNEEIFGYELLYRNNINKNSYDGIDGDQATSDVLINSFLNIGIEKLSEGRPCFINFTENLLKLGLPTYFSPTMLVVEILETVRPTEEVIDICRKLKELGYKIAVDDFYMEDYDINTYKLLVYTDIVKVDILNTPRDKQRRLLEKLAHLSHLEYLAEKVETRDDYEYCLKQGYKYFQGYFFSKPTILKTFDIPTIFAQHIQLINELSRTEPDINILTSFIERDISLSYKLLKLINSPAIRPMSPVSTIKQAIMMLGLTEIRRWIYVLAVRDSINENGKPSINEVVKLCFIRAKMCELIAEVTGDRERKSSFFIAGMFSLIDSLLDSPINQIIEELPLEQEIKTALLQQETNRYAIALQLVHSLERDDQDLIKIFCGNFNLPIEMVMDLYKQSLEWSISCLLIENKE